MWCDSGINESVLEMLASLCICKYVIKCLFMQNANSGCVGPESSDAGVAPSCQGCPNAAICAAAPKGPDPDIPLITRQLAQVKHKVMVISGKGGVGKSTMTKELAFALGARGYTVGLVDLDICGPSLPRLTGARAEDVHQSGDGIEPVLIDDNVTMMSIHYFLDNKNEALLFRGAKKNAVIKMFLKDVTWGELDIMLIDTPPGTSDEHITASTLLLQTGGVDGAVLVTTPQRVAEADVRREINFCRKAKVPILGIVENMSGFVCPNCHRETPIFPPDAVSDANTSAQLSSGKGLKGGAGQRLAEEFQLPLWGSVPIDPRLMKACEEGVPLSEFLQSVETDGTPNPTATEVFNVAQRLADAVGLPARSS